MKKLLMVALVTVAGFATVQAQSAAEKTAAGKAQLSLADARGQIDKAIESPEKMKELMKQLSAENQKKFLADVNKAIGDMPASPEEKAAKFLNINHAAMTAAQPGNATALLAEVFATVSPEALTVINERFAADLMNRAANPNITYTDEQYTKIATEAMKVINERVAETDSPSARSVFAILMFNHASNGTPADLTDKLVETMESEEAREIAKNEWIPAATREGGREAGYESLLASADANRRPDFNQVLIIAGAQHMESVLADIGGQNIDETTVMYTKTPISDAVASRLRIAAPTIGADSVGTAAEAGNPAEGGAQEGVGTESTRPTPVNPDPKPYPPQTM